MKTIVKNIPLCLLILLSVFSNPICAQTQKDMVGFDNGFYIQSKDGAFVFRPFGLIHTDFRLIHSGTQINTDDTQASTFLTRRLRLGFEGQLYGKIDYDLETNVGGTGAELIFAWMNFGYIPAAQVRIGQFKEPFNHEVLLPEKYLDFIERSIVATVVSPAEDIGIMVHNFGNPIGNVFEYGVGIFNGLGGSTEKKIPDKTFEYVGRVALYPFGASSNELFKSTRVAGYALYEGGRPEGDYMRPRTPLGFEFFPRILTKGARKAFGTDINWTYGPVSISAEYIRNIEKLASNNNDAVVQGWDLDLTYLITGEDKIRAMESGVEVAARIEKLQVDAGSPIAAIGFTDASGNPIFLQNNDVTTLTLGLNYYLNYNIKFQINYQNDWFGNSNYTPSSRDGNILKSADISREKLIARVQLYF